MRAVHAGSSLKAGKAGKALPRVFLDTNILLDVLLGRRGLVHHSLHIWQMCEWGQIRGVISAISMNNIHYVMSKFGTRSDADKAMSLLLDLFEIVPADASILRAAAENPGQDFEDAIQYYSALQAGACAIVTRNCRHYQRGSVEVLAPEDWLAASMTLLALSPIGSSVAY